MDEFLRNNTEELHDYVQGDCSLDWVRNLAKQAYLAGYEEASRIRVVGSAVDVKEFTP